MCLSAIEWAFQKLFNWIFEKLRMKVHKRGVNCDEVQGLGSWVGRFSRNPRTAQKPHKTIHSHEPNQPSSGRNWNACLSCHFTTAHSTSLKLSKQNSQVHWHSGELGTWISINRSSGNFPGNCFFATHETDFEVTPSLMWQSNRLWSYPSSMSPD